jgi:orotidine-5'-phosphate decarboxylase
VEQLVAAGDRVFLDLKFHDIPHTVAGAVAAATRLGVWMLNVHASGGEAMMQAAREAAENESINRGTTRPLVIAVTALTSLDQPALATIGIDTPMADHVNRLAGLARRAGLDGVVASPLEIEIIRTNHPREFVIVTPGIRGGAAETGTADDQNRTLTAADAVARGANYLVVGRPILAAPDPRDAAERIARELKSA